MKRSTPFLLFLLLFLIAAAALPPVHALAVEPIALNADFSGEQLPDGWTVVAYGAEDYSVYTEEDALVISSAAENDIRLCRMVQVEGDTVYCLSAEISADGVQSGRGVCLAIDNYTLDGTFAVSGGGTGCFVWMREELYFRTAPGQNYINIALRLGSYSEMSAGKARFRQVELCEIPNGQPAAEVISLESTVQRQDASAHESDEARDIRLRSYLHLFLVAAIVLSAILVWGFYRNRERIYSLSTDRRGTRRAFLLLLLAATLLRLILTLAFRGHDYDINCWQAWGADIAENGAAQFYTAPGHEWYDYPPAYMLVLGGLTWILNLLKIPTNSAAGVAAYMLPAYLADIGIAVLLMRFARRRGFSEGACLFLGGLTVFNPAAVILSGAWGQIDSILTLLLLLSFSELIEGRRISAGAIYGLAIMTKWQALIYGPVLAAEYIFSVRKPNDILHTFGGVAAAVLVILGVSLPCRGDQSVFWVVERFLRSAGGYDYATVEAYNFHALCGGNWKSSSLPIFAGISYKAFGTAAIIAAVGISLAMQAVSARRAPGEPLCARPERLFIPAAFCMFMIFMFGHYMHERYVFPVMALLLFAYVSSREKRFLLSSMLLSVVLALNEATAMFVVSLLAEDAVRGTAQHQTVIVACSFLGILVFCYTAYVCLQKSFSQSVGR